MQDQARIASWRIVRRRAMILVPLIVVVPLLWWLLGIHLPLLGQVVMGFLSILLLSVATAWTVVAAPRRGASRDAH